MKSTCASHVSALFALGLATILIAGCGGASSPAGLNGNYALTAQPPNFTVTPAPGFGGSLTQTGSTVAGAFQVVGFGCFRTSSLSVTGTVKSGALMLTASAPSAPVLTVKATVSSDGTTISAGTYTISGSCANNKGTITGQRIPPLHGTFSGTMVPFKGTAIQSTISISQGAPADQLGIFPITGSAKFSGTSCFTTGAISIAGVAGNQVFVNITTDEKTKSTVLAGGEYDPAARTLKGEYIVNGGACNGDSGSGTLTLQ